MIAMTLSLRYRIVLTLVPPLLLLVILGVIATILIQRLGNRIDAILRENYDSVLYMERLNEALERIDSSFTFALAGEEERARKQYEQNWPAYSRNLEKEKGNITLPGEGELVEELNELTDRYRSQGDAFYARPDREARRQDYFGPGGLLAMFDKIKQVSSAIRHLNQDHMEQASREAQQTARDSLLWFGAGLFVVLVLAGLIAWPIRAILQPIKTVTESALAIGAGQLNQVVPVMSRDELGHLADAFNSMARQLRGYRETNYSRLLRAQRTSQATIDSFNDPILVVDSEGGVEMANPAARRILGIAVKTGEQPSPAAWQPPEALRQPLAEALQQQRPYLPEGFDRALVFRTDGQEHFFLPRIMAIRDPYGNTLGAAVLFHDVTRFRLLDQVKNDLVATVSHELKTPLTSVRLALHLLLEEVVGPLTPKQTELILDARDNAERLLARVNNLLDLTRLERGREQLDIRPESPADLLQTAAEAIRPRAEDKGVAVVVEAPSDLPRVAADARRLGYALSNLLDNAVAYTERGGRIVLSATQADSNTVMLTVADTGVGIPPEHLPRIFERFYRIPGHSRQTGTGLGLAIVREVVAAHGGTITCESQPGSGTIFRLTLPIWTENRETEASPQHAEAAAS
jgi:PAS domain S-box-containing protein